MTMTTTTMSLEQIQAHAHSKMLEARNMNYIVNTRNFIDAFEAANDVQKNKLYELVKEGNLKTLYDEIRLLIKDCLEAKNIHELRKIAASLNIYGATKLTKRQLIYIIKKERDKNDKRRKN